MSPEEIMQALVWAREKVEPRLSVKAMAAALGVPRTTYDSWEKGKARPKPEFLDKIGKIRGLPGDWWTGKRFILEDTSQRTAPSPGTVAGPSVALPSVGYLTRSSLKDEAMKRQNEPVVVPSHMAKPHYVTALAESDDTGPELAEGWVLIFDPYMKGKIGQRVAVRTQDGRETCRVVTFEDGRLTYKGMNGQKPLVKDEADEEGVLVGYIRHNRPGKFSGEYDEEGI